MLKDKVIVGVSGGEFGARGFLDAYDAASGKRLWRWYAVPGPGEFGHDTWPGDSWKQGGSPMWLTGSFDPELNLVYWTVGNPGTADRSIRARRLDNLFSDSVVALDADTGQRKWHYQFTPNDGHDWDSCQDVILVDRVWRGQMRKLLLHADRNGYFYVLDRVTGSSSRPRRLSTPTGRAASTPPDGRRSCPDRTRAARAVSSSIRRSAAAPISRRRRTVRSPAGSISSTRKAASATSARRQKFEEGKQYIGRAAKVDPRESVRKPGEPGRSAGIKAIDPETGQDDVGLQDLSAIARQRRARHRRQLVFAAMRDGNLAALDARERQTPVAFPDRRRAWPRRR